MIVFQHDILNVIMNFPIKIFIAQAEVSINFNGNSSARKFTNQSFEINRFKEILKTFHDHNGDIIIFPEYYLPINNFYEIVNVIMSYSEGNKIYIIPMSQVTISDFVSLKRDINIFSEAISDDIPIDIFLNVALVFIKNDKNNLDIYCQFKTMPAYLETKPHQELFLGKILYLWNIKEIITFSVLICFSFIGKHIVDTYSLEALLPTIENGNLDYIFVPEWNPRPLHWTFIETINKICIASGGRTAIFFINHSSITNSAGLSSIVDLFSKKVMTSNYDIKDLLYPFYKHLIITSNSERLVEYSSFPPKLRIDKLSPDFIREIPIEIFFYQNGWILEKSKLIYEYKSEPEHKGELPPYENGEVADLLESRQINRRLLHVEDSERLINAIENYTDHVIKGWHCINNNQLISLFRLLGEYHDLKGCPRAACTFFTRMYFLSEAQHNYLSKIISNYLLMQASSRIDEKRYQKYALEKAKELAKFSENYKLVDEIGIFSVSILSEAALVISHYNVSEENMYIYGSLQSSLRSKLYNKNEPGKIKQVDKILERCKYIIEKDKIIKENDPLVLHYIDVIGLTNQIAGRPDDAYRSIDTIQKINSNKSNYIQYLHTKQNECLLHHLYEIDTANLI